MPRVPTQTEEVLELVMQYEAEVKVLVEVLADVRASVKDVKERGGSYCEESWRQMREVGVLVLIGIRKPARCANPYVC